MSENKNIPPERWALVRAQTTHATRPFVAIEWSCEWTVYHLKRWAFIELLETVGKFSLIAGLATYILSAGERKRALEAQQVAAIEQKKTRQLQAWQMLIHASGHPANGGRSIALTDLVKDGVILNKINLESGFFESTDFDGVAATIRFSRLADATFDGSRLSGTTFLLCELDRVSFLNSKLNDCKFAGSSAINSRFGGSALKNARFTRMNLSEAIFMGADISHARFVDANLRDANLAVALVTKTNFDYCDLRGADVNDIRDWKSMSVSGTKLFGIKNAPDGFVEWAKAQGADFSERD